MATKILVTGATGATGQQLVEKLSGMEGISVQAATRSIDKYKNNSNIEYVRFDYNDVSTIRNALQGVDKVFLVTAAVPEMFENEKRVIEEIKNASVKQIVKLSVAGAGLGEEGITFGKLHYRLEEMVKETGIAYTLLRPMSFMQNYSNFMSQAIKTQDAFYLPMGDGKVSIVDTRDIASVAVKAFTEQGHEGKTYTLTGPEPLSNYEIADILSSVLERKISYVDVSEDQARQGMGEGGMTDWSIERMLELYRINKAGHTANVSSDIEQVTGVKPTSFEQFARDYSMTFK
ncbi:SDR family oxidoreductase [Peribacillus cavernae]|uniref:SDR family oxidoreductase n=1 Tax=Peribacillus cavernae TaxID=1674310 RepID=A0A433HL63_9BACI|nr:SDR family oxidoreductase [Peribacillus cavernae]MDQ0220200.1 uncharacterized protein YbjT (DUF2867 family) [Peribacillus cavernae]RUQ28822.1 SDR family oxidoreductase [Peribacillus cavernae]